MVRPTTAQLPAIMSVRLSQRCTQPPPAHAPLSITGQHGAEGGIAKIGDDANQDCHYGRGALSIGTTIGLAAVVITAVPVLIIYLIFQRQLQGSVSAGTYK
jgi:hypothetical protein